MTAVFAPRPTALPPITISFDAAVAPVVPDPI